ncbi:hypothetical protein ACGFJ7_35295 [Actinoplanes sp. NPDC048988]|uniref:hypothetical protein n=1 Tax=Actinoplanes sp. NPDC048988 TaxID=3363901 RepID=UPI003721A2EC
MIDDLNLAPVVTGRARPGTLAGLARDLVPATHHDRYVAQLIGSAVTGLADDYDVVVQRIVSGCLELGRAHIAANDGDDDPGDAAAAFCGATYFAAWLAGTAVAARCAADELTAADVMLNELITPVVHRLGHVPSDTASSHSSLYEGMRLRRHITTLGYLPTPAGQPLLALARTAMANRGTRMAAIGQLTFDVINARDVRSSGLPDALQTAVRTWRPGP